jgi:hypothetical protein
MKVIRENEQILNNQKNENSQTEINFNLGKETTENSY